LSVHRKILLRCNR